MLYVGQRYSPWQRVDYQKHQQCNKYKTELIQYRRENNIPLEDMDDG